MLRICLAMLCLSCLAMPAVSFADWLGNIGLGSTYSNNYALQNGNYTNIEQDRVNRTGLELSGGLNWQRFSNSGGYNLGITGLMDRDTASNSAISNLSLSASRIQPFSPQWLGRFSARAQQYRNDDFTANSYDGGSLEATLGWFGQGGRGLDINLSALYEDHAKNPDARYKTRRLGTNVVYFFAHRPEAMRHSIGLGLQNHDADDDRRDGTSIFASFDMDQIRWGKNLLRLSLSWRQDRYNLAYSPRAEDYMQNFPSSGAGSAGPGGFFPMFPPGGGPGSGPGAGRELGRELAQAQAPVPARAVRPSHVPTPWFFSVPATSIPSIRIFACFCPPAAGAIPRSTAKTTSIISLAVYAFISTSYTSFPALPSPA